MRAIDKIKKLTKDSLIVSKLVHDTSLLPIIIDSDTHALSDTLKGKYITCLIVDNEKRKNSIGILNSTLRKYDLSTTYITVTNKDKCYDFYVCKFEKSKSCVVSIVNKYVLYPRFISADVEFLFSRQVR